MPMMGMMERFGAFRVCCLLAVLACANSGQNDEAAASNTHSPANDTGAEQVPGTATQTEQRCRAPTAGPDGNTAFATKLSETQCFADLASKRPAASLIPYDVRVPLWSDGASKRRWLALPSGSRLSQDANGDISLPAGAVLLKEFSLGSRVLETRMLARREDGQYAVATYRWNEAGTDADVVLGDWQAEQVGSVPWTYFGPAGCLMCHSGTRGNDLGLTAAQLNVTVNSGDDQGRNQLALWRERGILQETGLKAFPQYDLQTAAGKARAYLDVNCSSCHSPKGRYFMGFDFSVATPLSAMGLCNKAPGHGNFGVADGKLLVPGRPELSVLVMRMRSINNMRMPKFGSELVDTQGAAAVELWISSLVDCTDR